MNTEILITSLEMAVDKLFAVDNDARQMVHSEVIGLSQSELQTQLDIVNSDRWVGLRSIVRDALMTGNQASIEEANILAQNQAFNALRRTALRAAITASSQKNTRPSINNSTIVGNNRRFTI